MYCRTRSFSFIWSCGKSSFLDLLKLTWFFYFLRLLGWWTYGGVLQFKVFGLEMGSNAFPTSFRRVVRFVATWTFWIFFFGILPVIASLFLLAFSSFRQSSLTCPVFLQSLQVTFGSTPEERRPVPRRVAVGVVDIVGTGMSSLSSSPLSSSSRSKCVTIATQVAFSSLAILTERFNFGGNLA